MGHDMKWNSWMCSLVPNWNLWIKQWSVVADDDDEHDDIVISHKLVTTWEVESEEKQQLWCFFVWQVEIGNLIVKIKSDLQFYAQKKEKFYDELNTIQVWKVIFQSDGRWRAY